ncbi:hypothetical protein GGR53DRAFT_471716 [Hypoxylon sp. FL1150]|nr:hypothetical protein GGR53DRAFT_471716 [Hypoxylon sp. FL1150]
MSTLSIPPSYVYFINTSTPLPYLPHRHFYISTPPLRYLEEVALPAIATLPKGKHDSVAELDQKIQQRLQESQESGQPTWWIEDEASSDGCLKRLTGASFSGTSLLAALASCGVQLNTHPEVGEGAHFSKSITSCPPQLG